MRLEVVTMIKLDSEVLEHLIAINAPDTHMHAENPCIECSSNRYNV